MKHDLTLSALAIIIAGVILSCSKSDSAPTQAQLLIGYWKQTSYVRTSCTDPLNNESLSTCTTSCTTIVVTASTISIADPSQNGGMPQVFTYTVTGPTINLTPAPTETITFAVAGSVLTLTIQSPSTGAEANCTGVMNFTKQ